MVWNPELVVGVAVILWAPCLLKKGSFHIIGKQTSSLLCSQLYISKVGYLTTVWTGLPGVETIDYNIEIDEYSDIVLFYNEIEKGFIRGFISREKQNMQIVSNS